MGEPASRQGRALSAHADGIDLPQESLASQQATASDQGDPHVDIQ